MARKFRWPSTLLTGDWSICDQAVFQDRYPTTSPMLKDADLSQLGLTFSETYRGRFQRDNLNATLNVASDYALIFKNLLSTDPTGQKATLLVAIGGGVDQTLAVQNYFSRRVEIDVKKREGSQVNPSLIKYLIDRLFTGLYNGNFDLSKRNTEEVVTFLFANGLKATATMGKFKTIVDKLKTEKIVSRRLRTRSPRGTQQKMKSMSVENSAFWGSAVKTPSTVKWKKLNERSSSESLKLQSHDFVDMAKAIEGELPVAVMDARNCKGIDRSRGNDVMSIQHWHIH